MWLKPTRSGEIRLLATIASYNLTSLIPRLLAPEPRNEATTLLVMLAWVGASSYSAV